MISRRAILLAGSIGLLFAHRLAERPEDATLEEMRRRLIDRAADIRANPPPPGKHPKPFARRDLARLERIARRGALRLRFQHFRTMLRRDEASKASS